MKRCLACGTAFDSQAWYCPKCEWEPRQEAGFLVFAPELAESNDGFQPESFRRLAELEGENFWFRARNSLLSWALPHYFPNIRSFLEVGCGTGFVLSGIAGKLTNLRLAGSDVYTEALPVARSRNPGAELFQMDARRMPFEAAFDVVGAFDVIEHIEEDRAVLAEMYRVCRPGGGVLLTVPQHPWLWSAADEYGCHKRRYLRGELIEKVEEAGFRIRGVTSFVLLLLPLMFLARMRQRGSVADFDPNAELRIAPRLNQILERVLHVEQFAIRKGVSLPAGGSLLLAAAK
jgi:SAM-dependent methyltransferase